MATNCDAIKPLIGNYDALTPDEQQQVTDHIKHCRACGSLLKEYIRNDERIKNLGANATPPPLPPLPPRDT